MRKFWITRKLSEFFNLFSGVAIFPSLEIFCLFLKFYRNVVSWTHATCFWLMYLESSKCIKVSTVFSDLIKAPSNQWIELSAKLGFHYFLLLTKNLSTRQNVIHELTEKANNFLFKLESVVPGFNSSCLYDFTSYSWELRSWSWIYQHQNNNNFAALLRRTWSYLEIKEKFGLSSIRLTI